MLAALANRVVAVFCCGLSLNPHLQKNYPFIQKSLQNSRLSEPSVSGQDITIDSLLCDGVTPLSLFAFPLRNVIVLVFYALLSCFALESLFSVNPRSIIVENSLHFLSPLLLQRAACRGKGGGRKHAQLSQCFPREPNS